MMKQLSKYVSSREAASELGVTPMRVRQLLQSGELQAEKFAGLWAIDRAVLRRFSRKPRLVGRPSKKK